MRTLKIILLLTPAIALGAAILPVLAAAGSLKNLPGLWKGSGNVYFDGGRKELIKCAVIYKLNNGGKELIQKLNCTTTSSYKIRAVSELVVDGKRLSGAWIEKTTDNEGSVKGTITSKGFLLSVSGNSFKAAMRVINKSKCRQEIKISPSGLGVDRIRIDLRKKFSGRKRNC